MNSLNVSNPRAFAARTTVDGETPQTLANPLYREGQLPASFCWVFDRVSNGKPGEIYIEQLQASRQAQSRGKAGKSLRRRQERVRTIERVLEEHRERLRR
ncbi:hypothetical protein PY650_29465 [Rhizobium calliandrae]|uniref:Uncharacterized protein n=1 Tax=Rhizobium calliandrae TaxID=1312182 RepID=A0ABT7KM20_9HYPH|nr:hypothetical protein [Rhizobium calliandrae]MDL2409680.1 hypothetical protein [Rhizobium calliandrae]